MKSNEEFIQGIYAKAEKLQKEQNYQQTTPDNLIKIDTFHKKMKRFSSYAAGLAACFVCGVAIYAGNQARSDANDNSNRLETRGVNESGNTVELASADEKQTVFVLEDGQHFLDCKILSANQVDDIGQLEVQIVSKDDVNQTATLMIAQDAIASWQNAGDEVVVCVYDADKDGNYTIAPGTQVFLYTGLKEGQKQFQSAEGTILTEGELKEGIHGIQ